MSEWKKFVLLGGYLFGFCAFLIWSTGMVAFLKSALFTLVTLAVIYLWYIAVDALIK